MKPAQDIYYPPAGLSYTIQETADHTRCLDFRRRAPSYRAFPAGHERILVQCENSLGYRKKGDYLIFERPL